MLVEGPSAHSCWGDLGRGLLLRNACLAIGSSVGIAHASIC